MCGIVGIYNLDNAIDLAKEILVAQQSRGTDSTGIAYINNNELHIYKKAIPPSEFINEIIPDTSNIVIGHNRNATTNVSEKDQDKEAHPYLSEDNEFAIVHNGHISYHEPYRDLLETLGHDFSTGGVDSEVLVHILEELLYRYKRDDALKRFFYLVDDENILVLFNDKTLYAFPGTTSFYLLKLKNGIVIASELYSFKPLVKILPEKVKVFVPKVEEDDQMVKISTTDNKIKLELFGTWDKHIYKDNTWIANTEIMCDFCGTRKICEKYPTENRDYDRCYDCYKQNKTKPYTWRSKKEEIKVVETKKIDSDIVPSKKVVGKCEICDRYYPADNMGYCSVCGIIMCKDCMKLHKCYLDGAIYEL